MHAVASSQSRAASARVTESPAGFARVLTAALICFSELWFSPVLRTGQQIAHDSFGARMPWSLSCRPFFEILERRDVMVVECLRPSHSRQTWVWEAHASCMPGTLTSFCAVTMPCIRILLLARSCVSCTSEQGHQSRVKCQPDVLAWVGITLAREVQLCVPSTRSSATAHPRPAAH
jgi:hypothetical protein